LRLISEPVFNISRREHDLIRTKISLVVPDVKPASAFHHKVDFVGAGVRVTLLLLAWFKTIDVCEHPFTVEQIHLLHLLRGEAALRTYVLTLHFGL
jgi:hypothetical protein